MILTRRRRCANWRSWSAVRQEVALNVHDELVGYRGERVEVIWSVAGRGKVKQATLRVSELTAD